MSRIVPSDEKQSVIRFRHSTSEAASCGLFFQATTSGSPVSQVKLAAPRGVSTDVPGGTCLRTHPQMSAHAPDSTFESPRATSCAARERPVFRLGREVRQEQDADETADHPR